MMKLPLSVDWIERLQGTLLAIDQSPPEVTSAQQFMGTVMQSWQGMAAQSFEHNVNEVFASSAALESFLSRLVSHLGTFRQSMEQCQRDVNEANTVAAEAHIDLDAEGNLPGSEWGSAEVEWLIGGRRRVEGAVDIAVKAIHRAIVEFNSSLHDLSLTIFDVTTGPVVFGEELASVTTKADGWFKAHFDTIVWLSRLMGLAEQAEQGRFRSSYAAVDNAGALTGPTGRFPEARTTVSLLDSCAGHARDELQRLAVSFGSLQNLLFRAAKNYGDADRLNQLMSEGVLTATAASGLSIVLTSTDFASVNGNPPDAYIAWCKENGYYQSGEYEQCVAWAQYQRHLLGLPYHDGNGSDMCTAGNGVQPCGPDQVSEGSLISIPEGKYGHVMVVESVQPGPPLVFTCSELNVQGTSAHDYDGYGRSGNFLTNTTVTATPNAKGGYTYIQTRPGYGSTEISGLSFCTGLGGG